MVSTTIKSDGLASWWTTLPSSEYAAQLWVRSWTTLAAVILPLLLLVSIKQYRRMQQQAQKPFPFLDLPQELRDMVYEHFLDDPVYPAPAATSYQQSTLDWIRPGRWTLSTSSSASKARSGSKWIFLANKQVYAEYMDMLCKRRTFHFTVSPQTYKPVAGPIPSPTSTPTTTTTTTSPSSSSNPPVPTIWQISPLTLSKIHHSTLSLTTTSSMLGVTDPRSMTSSSWTLGRLMRQQLRHMSSITSFTLDAKALGDPLWNPLWIWFHASQSLKMLGTRDSDTVPVGPRLTRITFSLDTWSPGENFLEREGEEWEWFCGRGHNVGRHGGRDTTVREFCALLYRECEVCRGEEEALEG
ncbi:hypothetical protein DDE82_001925 [Stemphylium lycopersici]|nr:hypothetical protein DDE82_001925 [Stemphylium lycopersici]